MAMILFDARYLCPVVKARFLLSQHKRVRAMSEKYNVFSHVRQLMTFAIQPGLVIFKFRQVISRVTMQLSVASKIVLFQS
jgi:hypothetical protein